MKIVMAIGERDYQIVKTNFVARCLKKGYSVDRLMGDDCLIDDRICKWSTLMDRPQDAETHEMEIR